MKKWLETAGILLTAASVMAAEFAGTPYFVRGASLKLRHSVEPQAPGLTHDANVTVDAKAKTPAFTAVLKHGQTAFIGAAVMPEKGYFNFAGHTVLACDVKNESAWPVDVLLRIHSGPNPKSPTGRPEAGAYLMPGETQTIRVPLYAFRKNVKVKLVHERVMQGKPFGIEGPTGVDAEHVTALIFWSMTPYLRRDEGASRFSISNFRFSDELKPDNAPLDDPAKYFPLIDRYGQYRHAEWPGKIHSDEELKESAKSEAASWQPRPKDWNKYGGYAPGPTLKATGFFRTEKYHGKWYLVDPEGKLFFSMGIGCIFWWNPEFTGGCEHYFEGKGEYVHSVKCRVLRPMKKCNLIRWGSAHPKELYLKRFDAWGINTTGAWHDPEMPQMLKRPYTPILMHDRKEGVFGGNARDAFDPAFAEALKRELTGRYGWTINDPMCIGYYVTNEMFYGPEGTWAREILKCSSRQPGKQVFHDFLQKRYKTVAALNRAWGKNYFSFQQFLYDVKPPVTKKGEQDLKEFGNVMIRKFFEVSRNVLKQCAPHHLFLGSRFQMSAGAAYDYVARLFPEYVDVASYNCYWLGLDHFAPQIPDMPVIISEFNVGGVEARGHFSSGLAVSGFSPEARGEALKRYYESALRNPRIVGMHYFCLMEQQVCGRPEDGENMSLGVLDVTGHPYPEVVKTMRLVAEEAIPYRLNAMPQNKKIR